MQQKALIKENSTAAALWGRVLLPGAVCPASLEAHHSHLQASAALPWFCPSPAGWRSGMRWDTTQKHSPHQFLQLILVLFAIIFT